MYLSSFSELQVIAAEVARLLRRNAEIGFFNPHAGSDEVSACRTQVGAGASMSGNVANSVGRDHSLSSRQLEQTWKEH